MNTIDELMGFKLAAATATILANKYGITVNYCSDRKVPDSRGRTICGHTIEDGERIVIVDELINSGKTVSDRIEKLRGHRRWLKRGGGFPLLFFFIIL